MTRSTDYIFLDPYGNVADKGTTATADEATARASAYMLAMASEGKAGTIEFCATGDEKAVAYVLIDYDPDGENYCRKGEEPFDPAIHVSLEMICYNRKGKMLYELGRALGDIKFFRDEDDWVTGRFEHVSDIPERCDHLREIAKDLGLPA